MKTQEKYVCGRNKRPGIEKVKRTEITITETRKKTKTKKKP